MCLWRKGRGQSARSSGVVFHSASYNWNEYEEAKKMNNWYGGVKGLQSKM